MGLLVSNFISANVIKWKWKEWNKD